jgi:hypothetical protein
MNVQIVEIIKIHLQHIIVIVIVEIINYNGMKNVMMVIIFQKMDVINVYYQVLIVLMNYV